ncbi:MFS transporter [Romboutsia timonensis]|uniref:MFS transporter n=1 Tax=Romboutsia timonensis TaxID=1776391 RepID=UPI002A80161E|nr:MFS transporter [Romboutsia timonensis]MCI6668535.1 MFS transporter [Romboutsia timonensis]MDY3958719.1 MFS transporter [Romboutsia timonensis]
MYIANKEVLESSKVKPFGMQDKVGYMLGDVGSCLLFNFIGSYLLVFYTDVFGISAAAVGTLMAVSRVWDAINDPMMGVIVDKRKRTKDGKFRPYLKYMGIPLGIFTILTFLVIPNMPQGMKLPYAYITYIGFGMAYTAINIPYGSLASVMTNDPVQRTELSTWRNISSIFAMIPLMVLTPKLVFDASDAVSPKGFLIAAVLYVIIANIGYRLCYKMTTERIINEVKEDAPKASLGETLKALGKNKALIGLILSSLGTLTAMFLPNALNAYLFKDYFQAPGLLSLAGLLPMVGTFLAIPVTGKLVAKFGKKNIAIYSGIVSIAAYVVLVLFPTKNPMLYIALITVSGFGTALYGMIVWALVGDVIDYQEYLSGKREEGIVYATYSLSRKLVQAIVGSIGGFALAAIGYQSGAATQAPEVAESIRTIITVVPLIGFIFGTVCLKFVYNLSNKTLNEVNEELERRRDQ